MKKIVTLLFIVSLCHVVVAQSWVQMTSLYPGSGGRGSAVFALPALNEGFFIAGNPYDHDNWAYDTLSGNWTNLAANPGTADGTQVGFSINGYGYIATGTGWGCIADSTLWKYDPTGNTWTKMPHFPGGPRGYAVGFELNGKGYVGGGVLSCTSTGYQDFYAYDPVANKWDTIAPCPGAGCMVEAVGFSINGKGYIATGDSIGGGTYYPTNELWEYDPSSNTWTKKANYPGGNRGGSTGFATCDKGFVGLGYSDGAQSIFHYDFWEYDPIKDKWTQIANYGGKSRVMAKAFVIGKSCFVGLGYDSTNATKYDLWEYIPQVSPAFSADTSVCAGQTVTFTDTSNYSPDHWMWTFNGGTPGTDTAQNPTVVYTTTGTFDVTLTAWNSCDSATNTFSKYIAVTPGPSVSVTPAAPLVCNGHSILLTASGTGTYQWVGTSNTTDTITVTPKNDTSYELLVTSGSCTLDTFIAVKVGNLLNVAIQPPSETLCAGNTVVLNASGGNIYSWSPSTGLSATTGSSVIANPTLSVTYTVTAMDTVGCSGTALDTITVFPAPNVPTISQKGDTLFSSAKTDNQWYENGKLISGADSSYLVIGLSTDTFTVAVENPADGCTSVSAPDVTSGINQLAINNKQVSIYPNPTNSSITINISSSVANISEWNLRVTDVLGRTIYTRNSLDYNNVIDLSNLADAVYFILVTNKTDEGVFKVIKQ